MTLGSLSYNIYWELSKLFLLHHYIVTGRLFPGKVISSGVLYLTTVPSPKS